MVELFLGDSLYDADMLPASSTLKTLEWDFDTTEEDMTLRFTGAASPEFYGIALDGNSGLAVDNIPLRGCSGPFLTRMDKDLLADMYGELNVGLFILQFGGNMVPAVIENFRGYENWFVNQVSLIKETCPDAAILIIGVADMSLRENNRFITNPNVEKVRAALKNAARRSGVAYWDMYRAMGGRNSMPSWVNATPSLAAGDYVHFNPLGARTIAQMFYNAFILEYEQFEKDAQP
jgi:lysophospholipase L1-like esterase